MNIPSFQEWYQKGYYRKEAIKNKVILDYEELLPIVKDARNKKFDHLGVVIGFWNGYPDEQTTSIFFNCGSSSNKVPNSVIMNLPYEGTAAKEVLIFEVLKNILEVLIKIWNPEKAVIQSNLTDTKVKFTTPFLEIGWLTYFSSQYQQDYLEAHPPFDEKLNGYGDFLIITKDIFSSDNTLHIRKLQEYVDQTEFRV